MFWLIVTGLTIFAMLLIAAPLVRRTSDVQSDLGAVNAAVIRQQLAELDNDLGAGDLNPNEYDSARQDLEKALVYDLNKNDRATHHLSDSVARWSLPVLMIVLPLVAFSLYAMLGADRALWDKTSSDVAVGAANAEGHEIEAAVEQLSQRLKQQPNDRDGWLMLARSNVFLQRYADAVGAYANAYRLNAQPDADFLVDYADAIGMANGRKLAGMPAELLQKALTIDPDNLKGLWLSAHLHDQAGAVDKSIGFFKQAIKQLPPDSQDSAVMSQQLADVEARAGRVKVPGGPAAITVTVELGPDLDTTVTGDETLFIFARAATGPRMPLAIVRRSVSDLPLSVTLDDSLAMSPALRLSNFAVVNIGARISKSGNATPQSGDLTGNVEGIELGKDSTVNLMIDARHP